MALHDIREVRIPIELDKHPHAVFRPERLRRAGGQIRLSGSSISEDAAGLREGAPHAAVGRPAP